jgi:hypothetical protein
MQTTARAIVALCTIDLINRTLSSRLNLERVESVLLDCCQEQDLGLVTARESAREVCVSQF